MPGRFVLTPGRLGLAELRASDGENVEIDLDPVARPPIEESRVLIADLMAEGRHVYGLNTGFGQLAKTTRCGSSSAGWCFRPPPAPARSCPTGSCGA